MSIQPMPTFTSDPLIAVAATSSTFSLYIFLLPSLSFALT